MACPYLASDRESMFYAEGWAQAQAQAQGNLLLLLYGESRGRAAEYLGPTHLERSARARVEKREKL